MCVFCYNCACFKYLDNLCECDICSDYEICCIRSDGLNLCAAFAHVFVFRCYTWFSSHSSCTETIKNQSLSLTADDLWILVLWTRPVDLFDIFDIYIYITQTAKLIIIMLHFSWEANHHIRMISEGSCDTEYITFYNFTVLIVHIYQIEQLKSEKLNCLYYILFPWDHLLMARIAVHYRHHASCVWL